MGLSCSKQSTATAGQSSTSSSPSSCPGFIIRKRRFVTNRILNSSCLRSRSSDKKEAQVSDRSCNENGKTLLCPSKNRGYIGVKDEEDNEANSRMELHQWGEESSFANGNTSSNSLNPPNRFLSRFSFYPRSSSFRMFKANTLGGTAANEEDEFTGTSSNAGVVNTNSRRWGCEFFPSCFTGGSPETQFQNDDHESLSVRDALRSGINSRDENYSLNSLSDDARIITRIPTREPAERNVRYSRTLSVGRLRDRVLHRATTTPDSHSQQPDRETRLSRRFSVRRSLGREEEDTSSDNGHHIYSDNGMSSSSHSFFSGENIQEITRGRTRETRYNDLLDHRSHFLERRRRIRSHVRALQRLGSRFESLSSHERSCILSGQHRGGQCNCQIAPREANTNDDANATASISRIVMLAEALFEVLDEIHQQSVVLSSRPSVSSIGSIPAPNEVVESLPLKIFSRLKKKTSEEAAQCYICLVEYEEGDSMRILPCHHEFHRTCVDKWLKEIHRVCPLCRGDICRLDQSTV